MAYSVVTKFLGPTDHRGSRVRAVGIFGAVTIPWDHALDSLDNHYAAVRALLAKCGVTPHGNLTPSESPVRGHSYVFTFHT